LAANCAGFELISHFEAGVCLHDPTQQASGSTVLSEEMPLHERHEVFEDRGFEPLSNSSDSINEAELASSDFDDIIQYLNSGQVSTIRFTNLI
jgi:hypothetical protein